MARLLAGKSLVLIGGRRRRDSQEALRKAFGLESLLWIETKEHQSIESFKPMIARPEVAMVLLAIRWSSHGFGEVSHLCERHGKPLVRLPGGYSPNQVAAQILAQCSEQLGPAEDDRPGDTMNRLTVHRTLGVRRQFRLGSAGKAFKSEEVREFPGVDLADHHGPESFSPVQKTYSGFAGKVIQESPLNSPSSWPGAQPE